MIEELQGSTEEMANEEQMLTTEEVTTDHAGNTQDVVTEDITTEREGLVTVSDESDDSLATIETEDSMNDAGDDIVTTKHKSDKTVASTGENVSEKESEDMPESTVSIEKIPEPRRRRRQ